MKELTADQAGELTRKAFAEYISVVNRIKEFANDGCSNIIVPELSFHTRQKLTKDGFVTTITQQGENIFWGHRV